MTDETNTIGPMDYGASYYGVGDDAPTSNYRGYAKNSRPHWAAPLAAWLVQNTPGAWLDLGGAYGHLIKAVQEAAEDTRSKVVEWSQYAHANRVVDGDTFIHGDVRQVVREMPAEDRARFGTIVSLDFLEHLTEEDGAALIATLAEYPANVQIHVIGANNPKDPSDVHMQDPTHQNHEALSWYHDQFAAAGFEIDTVRTDLLRDVPAWKDTDWRDRIFAYSRPEKPARRSRTSARARKAGAGETPDAVAAADHSAD